MDGTENIGMEPIDVSNVNWWVIVAVAILITLAGKARAEFLRDRAKKD